MQVRDSLEQLLGSALCHAASAASCAGTALRVLSSANTTFLSKGKTNKLTYLMTQSCSNKLKIQVGSHVVTPTKNRYWAGKIIRYTVPGISSTSTSLGPHLPFSPLACQHDWLPQPACSSPLVLPESSQNIWLMVTFCRAVISEIMSLDLRRSSMCTDCQSPKDRGQKKKIISCLQHALLEELPKNYLPVPVG